MKPLIVGEANPYTPYPAYYALYPWPPHSAGGRLARMLRMNKEEYLRAFDRVNLFEAPPATWSAPEAREKAREVEWSTDAEVIFMLGARVAAAFGHRDLPVWGFRERANIITGRLVRFIYLPHPSGRCRVWNDKRAEAKLRRIVRKYL